MQEPELEYVSTIDDIKDNIRTFNEQAKDNLAFIYRDYLTGVRPAPRYWVYDPDTSQFGPGKFVAYRNMDFESRRKILDYRKHTNKKVSRNGVIYDGGVAHKKITKVTHKKFNDYLINEFENWADRLGIDLSTINTDKYKFVKL